MCRVLATPHMTACKANAKFIPCRAMRQAFLAAIGAGFAHSESCRNARSAHSCRKLSGRRVGRRSTGSRSACDSGTCRPNELYNALRARCVTEDVQPRCSKGAHRYGKGLPSPRTRYDVVIGQALRGIRHKALDPPHARATSATDPSDATSNRWRIPVPQACLRDVSSSDIA